MGICNSKNRNPSGNQRSAKVSPSIDDELSSIEKRWDEAAQLPNVAEKVQQMVAVINTLSNLKKTFPSNQRLLALSNELKDKLLLLVDRVDLNDKLDPKTKLNQFRVIINTADHLRRTHSNHPILRQLMGAAYYKVGMHYSRSLEANSDSPAIYGPCRQNALDNLNKAIHYGYKVDEVRQVIRVNLEIVWNPIKSNSSPSNMPLVSTSESRALVFSAVAPTAQSSKLSAKSDATEKLSLSISIP